MNGVLCPADDREKVLALRHDASAVERCEECRRGLDPVRRDESEELAVDRRPRDDETRDGPGRVRLCLGPPRWNRETAGFAADANGTWQARWIHSVLGTADLNSRTASEISGGICSGLATMRRNCSAQSHSRVQKSLPAESVAERRSPS